LDCYIEWQVGYDTKISDTDKQTTLRDKTFIGANGKNKCLYELSEWVYYLHDFEIVSEQQLLDVKEFLLQQVKTDLMDEHVDLRITRSHPITKQFYGIDFYQTDVKYPLLIHRFENYEVIAEIKITEKQVAVGVQPMLYFCFPITELSADTPLLGRTAKTKEEGKLIINKNNHKIFIDMLNIFGVLSKNHNHDVVSIIDTILK